MYFSFVCLGFYLFWVGFFLCFFFLRFVPLLQMLTEMNEGFYGLGPLNQTAVQAVGILLRFRLNPQLQLLWCRFKSLGLTVSQKQVRGMERCHRLDASSVPRKQNCRVSFAFKYKHGFPSPLRLQCWFSPLWSYCTVSPLEGHKTQKEFLGRWPQSSQNNAKCHSFPQAGIPGESSRLSERQKQFSPNGWMMPLL